MSGKCSLCKCDTWKSSIFSKVLKFKFSFLIKFSSYFDMIGEWEMLAVQVWYLKKFKLNLNRSLNIIEMKSK